MHAVVALFIAMLFMRILSVAFCRCRVKQNSHGPQRRARGTDFFNIPLSRNGVKFVHTV